jgi:formylglycine-generating enzyme required for sulfatase activity
MASLSGDQKRRLHAMLRQAFSQQDLRELFAFHLDRPLDDVIAPNDDARAVALKVITASDREGSLPGLLRAVAEERPGRPDVQDLIAELLAVLEGAPSSAPRPPAMPAAPTVEPVVQSALSADVSRVTPHIAHTDPLLITDPIRMEFVRVDDGRPLRMGTPPGQVQDMLKRFDWAKAWDDEFKSEQPASVVRVAPFAIGRYPVTNAQYAAFVEATGHPAPAHFGDWGLPPPGEEDHPW